MKRGGGDLLRVYPKQTVKPDNQEQRLQGVSHFIKIYGKKLNSDQIKCHNLELSLLPLGNEAIE